MFTSLLQRTQPRNSQRDGRDAQSKEWGEEVFRGLWYPLWVFLPPAPKCTQQPGSSPNSIFQSFSSPISSTSPSLEVGGGKGTDNSHSVIMCSVFLVKRLLKPPLSPELSGGAPPELPHYYDSGMFQRGSSWIAKDTPNTSGNSKSFRISVSESRNNEQIHIIIIIIPQ